MSLHPVLLSDDELLRDCVVRHGRRRGPGGQHRNKTESAVVIIHTPTGVEGQAAERRSQFDNHRMAVKRLRLNLALQVRSTELANSSPSALWCSRRHDDRIACNSDHADFPVVLAEALDVIMEHQAHISGAALQLGITPSQLIKLLKQEPRAFAGVNTARRERGLHLLD